VYLNYVFLAEEQPALGQLLATLDLQPGLLIRDDRDCAETVFSTMLVWTTVAPRSIE